MKRRLLLFTMTLAMLTFANVQQVRAYSTNDLTAAGWTQVTDLGNLTVSDFYFVLVDAGTSNYSVANPLPGTNERPAYQVLIDPLADKSQLWKLSYDSANARYAIQSAVDDWYFQGGTGDNQGWTDLMSNALNDNCYFTFANSDGKFSITSTISTGTFVGPWNNNGAVNLAGDRNWNDTKDDHYESLACNKSAAQAPGYYIYFISRSTYDAAYTAASAALTANGWTLVNTAEGLGLDGYYYAFVDCSEDGYESNLVMAGSTNSRPNYQVFDANATIQHWNLIAKGEGFQMQNRNTNTYAVCNDGASWNTGFTNDADNQYTEFRFTLADGKWTICNVCATDNFLGRWENSPLRPAIGESIAANKAAAAGKRLFLIYSIPTTIADVAQELPEGGAMTADQWYYFDVDDENVYNITATTFADIVYTTDGTLTTNTAGAALPGEKNVTLPAGRYYIKSSSANNFALTLSPKANATDMEQLAGAIAGAEAHTLGFDFKGDENGTTVDEYAPYNNVESLTLLAAAKDIDQDNPSAYYQNVIQELTAALNTATWTANTSEVNAIDWKTNYTAADVATDNYIHPVGWTNTGYNTRVMNDVGTNAGIAAVNGTAIMAKYNTTYGEVAGYTMPLKADTYYKITFKYCGWENTPTTNVVLTGPNDAVVVVTPASFRPETNNGHNDATHWYTYTATFKTGETAGNYTLALNKVETGQQQIAWGDMELVRADVADLNYTLETRPMNAAVATAQTDAETAYTTNGTVESYEALLAAIANAKASADIYATIQSRIGYLDAQKGTVDISELTTKYNNGEYANADDVITNYRSLVAADLNSPAVGADMTPYIVNPSFEFGDMTAWSYGNGSDQGAKRADSETYRFSDSDGDYVFNTWNDTGTEVYIYQDLSNLPWGRYEVSAVFASDANISINFRASVDGGASHIDNVFTTGQDNHTGVSKSFELNVTNGSLRIAATAPGFFKVDKFQLKYIGNPAVELPTDQMNAEVKAAMLAAEATYDADQSQEKYNALLAAIETANQSIALYKQIKARLDLLTSESQRGSLSEEAVKRMEFYTKYSNGVVNKTADNATGTYTSVDEILPLYKANIAAYYAANAPADNDDLTAFVVNQSFEFGNTTGWTPGGVKTNGAGTEGNLTNPEGNYVGDYWNPNATEMVLTQDITGLPNGTYEVSAYLDSFVGQTINLFANTGSSTLTAEEEKFYQMTAQCVVNNGTLTIKVQSPKGTGSAAYFRIDNVRLKYLSADATIAPALAVGQMSQTAKQAMLDAQAAHTARPSVENYNALLDQIDEAQQSIAVYEQIASTLAKLTENASQRGDIDEATEKAMTFYTNYSAGKVNGAADATTGTYETLDDMIAQYRTDIANYWKANVAAGKDLTAYIVNQGFEFGNVVGWEEENKGGGVDAGARDAHNETYMFSDSEGDFIFNSWNNNWAEITLTQTLNGVPQGTYEMTAVFAADGFNNIEFIGTNIREDGTPDETADKFRPVDINQRADKKTGLTRTIEVFVTDGKLKINGNTWGFFKADNFRLVYKSATLSDLADEPMNRYEKNNYDAAKAAYEANPTQENLRELAACKIICENSIKAYKAAKKTLDHVKDMMDHTNVYTYDAFFTIDDMYRKYGPEEGFYGFRTLEDDVAYDLERMFFGNGNYRDSNNENIPAVPFIASAWDCGHNGYAYVETGPGKEGTEPGSDYYGNTWSREGLDDGTNMLTPYLEYWRPDDNLLDPRVLTATVEGRPNAEYTVKMFVRVRTNVKYVEGDNSTKPHGMTIQIGDGAKFTPNWQYIDNEGTQYVLNNGRQLWVCNLWLPAHQGDANNTSYLLPKGNADAEGNFKIKFEIEEGSNVTWLSMKDVYVNYESEVPETEMAALKAQIDYADAHKLGFDFKGDEHETAVDEYAPYNNVQQLMALKRAKQVYDSPQNVFLVRNVTKALKAVNYTSMADDLHPVYNEATDLWTKNTEEMNGFYWKNDYTNSDVEHIEWYEYKDDCITPSGWDLIGRNDGFNTGIKKLGVNTEDTGMKALEDQTGLLTKYETDYGRQVGYTLPLKKGVKYIMTFKYAYMGEGTCTEPTDITLTVPAAGASGDDTTPSGLEVTTFTPEGQGTEDLGKWKMYRATFTPTIENAEHPGEPVNYLITFDKDNAHDPVPVMLGELTLVRYKEAAALGNNILIDGTNQVGYSYTPDFVGGDFKVTRSWNNGGETADGAYNTLVLPFSLDGSELKTALGDNFNSKVYFYTGATYTGGDEYYTLNFDERENSGIFANVPVLIWNEKANSINNLTNYEFKNTVTKYVKNDLTVDPGYNDDTKYKYNLVGTYETIKIPAGASYITADNNFKKSTGKANLAATRAYFIPLDKDGNVSTMAKLMGFSINDIPTGIMAIEEDGEMHVTSGNIYTVDGRLVRQNATSLEDLPKGIYIVDGKKYFVK